MLLGAETNVKFYFIRAFIKIGAYGLRNFRSFF